MSFLITQKTLNLYRASCSSWNRCLMLICTWSVFITHVVSLGKTSNSHYPWFLEISLFSIKIDPPFASFSPPYDDFKISPYLPLCSSNLHKYNYDKAPYKIFQLPPVFPGKLLQQVVILKYPDQTNSPFLHWHTKEHLLNCILLKSLTNN